MLKKSNRANEYFKEFSPSHESVQVYSDTPCASFCRKSKWCDLFKWHSCPFENPILSENDAVLIEF